MYQAGTYHASLVHEVRKRVAFFPLLFSCLIPLLIWASLADAALAEVPPPEPLPQGLLSPDPLPPDAASEEQVSPLRLDARYRSLERRVEFSFQQASRCPLKSLPPTSLLTGVVIDASPVECRWDMGYCHLLVAEFRDIDYGDSRERELRALLDDFLAEFTAPGLRALLIYLDEEQLLVYSNWKSKELLRKLFESKRARGWSKTFHSLFEVSLSKQCRKRPTWLLH